MNDLTTLPFDSSQDNLREITAAQRRMLYRDLWSDMIVEQFSFVAVGSGNFEVSGVCLVAGAYARFDRFMLNTADVVAGATNVVARIEADGQGGQDVFIRLVTALGANDLRIGTATIAAGPVVTQIAGLGASPIRIPDRTIVGTKLANATITSTQIANNAVTASRIADNAVGVRALTNNGVTAPAIASRAVEPRNLPSNLFRRVNITSTSTTNFTFAHRQTREATYTVPVGWAVVGFFPMSGRLNFSLAGSFSDGNTLRIVMRNNWGDFTIGANVSYCSLLLAPTSNRSFETVTRPTSTV